MTLGCVYTLPPPALGRVNYIHIGVGSDVVCSIPMGNTRASIRGAGNSDDSTLFLCLAAKTLARLKTEGRYGCID